MFSTMMILLFIIALGIVFLVNRKLNNPVVKKIATGILFLMILFLLMCLYGSTMMESFSNKITSATNINSFAIQKTVLFILLAVLLLFLFTKTIYIFVLFKTHTKNFKKKEQSLVLNVIYFDIDTVPDNRNFENSKSFLGFNKMERVKTISNNSLFSYFEAEKYE